MMDCDECGGKVVIKKVEHRQLGVLLGIFEAEVCEKCGEQVFSMGEGDKITQASKDKRLWGLQSRQRLAGSAIHWT